MDLITIMKRSIRNYTILFFFFFITVLQAGYNDMVLTPYIEHKSGQAYNGPYELYVGFVTANFHKPMFV